MKRCRVLASSSSSSSSKGSSSRTEEEQERSNGYDVDRGGSSSSSSRWDSRRRRAGRSSEGNPPRARRETKRSTGRSGLGAAAKGSNWNNPLLLLPTFAFICFSLYVDAQMHAGGVDHRSDPDVHNHNRDHSHVGGLSEYTDEYLARARSERRKLSPLHHATGCGTSSIANTELAKEMGSAHERWKRERHGNDVGRVRRHLRATRYVVPVYFHVYKKTTTDGALHPLDRQRFIKKLNSSFRRTPFRFNLYGHAEHVNLPWSDCQGEVDYKTFSRVDSTDVLNVYVCNTHVYSEGLVGFAHYPPITRAKPELDGVVIMNPAYKVFWDETVFNGLVHEVGHWFGLAHTFEGGCDAGKHSHFNGHESYFFEGDGVNDTAAHSSPTYAEEVGFESCWRGLTPPLNTCPQNHQGIDGGNDPIDNYMNYLPGFCFERYGHFTPGQVERMVAEYEEYRYQPTCRWSPCKTKADCCGDESLRCIHRKRNDRSLCLPCKGLMRKCKVSEQCCTGFECDPELQQCVTEKS